MRSPAEIHAPPIPHDLPWVNVATLRMDKQIGRPVLVEFFDFCRVNSLRTLPYLKAWHARYAEAGLRVISVHCPGYRRPARRGRRPRRRASGSASSTRSASTPTSRCGSFYDNAGLAGPLPVRPALVLFDYHYGEGAYAETERAIQELLGVERRAARADAPGGRSRGADRRPDARAGRARTPGPTRPAAVWAVLERRGHA